MRKRILIISAHPDDEILGCGAAIARLVREEYDAYTLILGEGPASRYGKKDRKKKQKDLKELKAQVYKANAVIGVKRVFIYDFPDNKFDSVPLLDTIKVIEGVKRDIQPHIIYTHYRNDLNIDHRITYNAVLTACRPVKEETVKEIYSFEIPSSTEWNYPSVFSPAAFIDVSKTIDKKIEAIKCYKDELKRFPHPRSEEAIRVIAKRWGTVSGLNCAEAFEVIRSIK